MMLPARAPPAPDPPPAPPPSAPQSAPQEGAPQKASPPGGIAAGAPQKAEYDSEHRPITAGGFLKSGPVIFLDTAEKAGLTTWHHTAGTPEKRFILEAKGAGVALLDYDNDGWLDIYLVNGSTYAALGGKRPPPHAPLFHKHHDRTLTAVP